MPKPTRTLFTLLLALSLLGGWTVQAATSCGGRCCVAEAPAPRPMHRDGTMTAGIASGCCCGDEAVPCDLERGELHDAPPRALVAAPKVEPPGASPLAAVHLPHLPQTPASAALRSAADPPGRSPPDPLYLRHLSLRC
ncbi:MAG: hypothetical protein P1P84_00955 [Deferrisomatales bacterium]|nr:hypothetical protein [Deferrisomatales bacterium]